MLTKQEREQICSSKKLYKVYYRNRKEHLPDWLEVKQDAFNEILEKGFTTIEQVAPEKANCIIRIFYKMNFHCDALNKHSMCGFNCFIKKSGRWVAESVRGDGFEIDFTKHIIRSWIFQDEYVDYDCDFFDLYVKIS